MFAQTAKGFHVHPPNIPKGTKAEDWMRRLFVKEWSDAENLAAFGPETLARYGTGRNYVAYFVFSGSIDPATGMLMNISEIKERAGQVLHEGFDHKFLNEDNMAFASVPPTTENVARELFNAAAPLFADGKARLVACHLSEFDDRSAPAVPNKFDTELDWIFDRALNRLPNAQERSILHGLYDSNLKRFAAKPDSCSRSSGFLTSRSQ